MTSYGPLKSKLTLLTAPLRSTPFLAGAAFCIALIVFEAVFFPAKYQYAIFSGHLKSGNYARLFVFCGLSAGAVLLSLLFFWAAFASRPFLRLFYLLVFTASIFTEYLIYSAFGHFSQLADLATALGGVDAHMAGNAFWSYVNWLALIPVLLFASGLVLTRKYSKTGIGTAAAVVLALVTFSAISTYFTSNLFFAPSLTNSVRTAVSYPVGWYIGTINGPPEGLAYGSPRELPGFTAQVPPKNNIVFIVDESMRGDRLSINGYAKPTTPTLEELSKKGMVANWGIASSGGTCSRNSNLLLLTGLTKLPDTHFEVYRLPTIFQYARAMGYKNYYFDGQTDLLWNGKDLDIPDYGTWIKVKDISQNAPHRYQRDAEIARRVKEIVEASTGNFIWVNKFGVHPPYEDSFPNEQYSDSGHPDIDRYLSQSSDALENSYDRAITYNLESFFSTLFVSMPTPETVYVYTSDHGQSSLGNGARSTHCFESRSEATVPLMIIADPADLKGLDTTFKASHANIFATLLDMMSYPESERKYVYAISLLRAKASDSAPRFYYTDELQFAKGHPFD